MATLRFKLFFFTSIILPFLSWSNPARGENSAAPRAKKHFLTAREVFQSSSDNAEAAWKFAQACFDWAEFAENDKQRAEIADEGIDACKPVTERHPELVEGHYYLAMNLGQLARTKTFGALKLVSQMEGEFKRARSLNEKFDFAGPDRNLGLLYRDAPGWPTSIGSRSKARQHLERAAKLSPNYPENRLNLLEAYLRWNDKNGARREFDALKELWPAMKKEFSGEQWESSWADWEQRWEKIQAKVAESPEILESARRKK